MKPLTIVLIAAALALVPAGAARAEIIPVQKSTAPKSAVDNAGPSPLQAAGPILSAIVGIGIGAGITATVTSAVAPAAVVYPAAILGGAVGAMLGWNAYKRIAEPGMVRAAGAQTAETPSLLQLAVEIRTAN